MRIYRIRSASNAKGNFLFKEVVQKESANWYDEAYAKIDAGMPLEMKWNWGCKTRKIGDLVPSTAPGLLLTGRVVDVMGGFFPDATRFTVTIDNGQSFVGINPKHFSADDTAIDHVFMISPRHNYPMVTESFKNKWEASGFLGATFEEIHPFEFDDNVFVSIDAASKR